jgi:hypothetical protein
MSKTGINFERCNVVSAQLHNERDAAYLESVRASGKATYELFSDRTELNTTWNNPAYQGENLEQILDDCRERYRDNVGQEPQEEDRVRKVKDKKTGLYREVRTAGWSPIREGVCPVKEDTAIADFAPVIAWLEERGVHVISISLHRDEGHEDPVTGERKYNHHGHVIADWTDHETGRTAKLTAKDMSELNQVVLPAALGMEAGTSKTITGADHLTPQQQREKAAAENTRRLLAENSALKAKNKVLRDENSALRQEKADLTDERDKAQQRAESALERARTAEKAASREQLRSSAADVGARVLGIFGRGAVAEANTERDDAIRRAEEAEQAAADAQARAEAAEEAQKQASLAAFNAETARRTAEDQKAAYGREMYDKGHAKGYTAGRQSVADDIKPLQDSLAEKQDVIDQLQADRDGLAEWFPTSRNWRRSLDEMREAGLTDDQAKQVFRDGAATVYVPHRPKALNETYAYLTDVKIDNWRMNDGTNYFGPLFRVKSIGDVWRTAKGYVKAVAADIWQMLSRRNQQDQDQTQTRKTGRKI